MNTTLIVISLLIILFFTGPYIVAAVLFVVNEWINIFKWFKNKSWKERK